MPTTFRNALLKLAINFAAIGGWLSRSSTRAGLLVWLFVLLPSVAGAADVRCGAYCLYVALKALDVPVKSYDAFEKSMPEPSDAGYSMAQLKEAAEQHGAYTLGVKTSIDNLQLRQESFACIALVREGHFLLLAEVEDGIVKTVDPPNEGSIPAETVSSLWDGTALLISPEPLTPEEELGHTPAEVYALMCILAVVCSGTGVWIWSRRKNRTGTMTVLLGAMLSAFTIAGSGCSNQPGPAKPTEMTHDEASPRIDVEPPGRNLGDIPLSSTGRDVAFTITNNGDARLDILRFVSSCGCAAATLTTDSLNPGVAAQLRVKIDSSISGARKATVSLRTNDPQAPESVVNIAWNAVGKYVAEPESFDLGIVRPGEIRRFSSRLRRTSFDPSDDSQPDQYQLQCSPQQSLTCERTTAEKGDLLQITLQAGNETGMQHGRVYVYLNNPGNSECMLPVQWIVRPEIQLTPDKVFLGSGISGKIARGQVVIAADEEKRLEIELPNAADGGLDVSCNVKRLQPNRILIEIRTKYPAESGASRSELAVNVIEPVKKTIRVPLIAYVSSP